MTSDLLHVTDEATHCAHRARRIVLRASIAALALVVGGSRTWCAESPPPWAFPDNPPDFKPPPDDGKMRRVPDSSVQLALAQVRDKFFAPDWHPDDHPPMPEVVARGRKPDVFACGFCHRAEGTGGPENANLAGLPAAYIVQQMRDYRSGARTSSAPKWTPPAMMRSLSKGATDAEIEDAAKYFSSIRPRQSIRVVETDSVPRTRVAGFFLADTNSGDREPIAQRIIEVPENLEQYTNRDSRSRFIAYAPPGSIAKGKALVSGGAGKTVQCSTCHGRDLKGQGAVPPIVGRSPSYMVRQLIDYQTGARAGAQAGQMKPAVAQLHIEDMIAIAAYLASMPP